MNDAEQAAVLSQTQRRAAGARDLVDRGAKRRRLWHVLPGLVARELEHRVDRALAQQAAAADVDAGQPGDRRKLDELRFGGCGLACYAVFLPNQRDDGA